MIKYDSNVSGIDVLEVAIEVCSVDEDYDAGEGFVCTLLDEYVREKNIKEVVTKEQFESISYKVKE